MSRVLEGMVTGYVLVAIATAVAGYGVEGQAWFLQHFALGLFVSLLTCLIHVAVFTYFTATGKIVKLATEHAKLDPVNIEAVKLLKRRVTLVSMAALGVTVLTVIVGAWVTHAPRAAMLHGFVALVMMGVNIVAFVIEHNAIAENRALLDRVLAEHDRRRPDHRVVPLIRRAAAPPNSADPGAPRLPDA